MGSVSGIFGENGEWDNANTTRMDCLYIDVLQMSSVGNNISESGLRLTQRKTVP